MVIITYDFTFVIPTTIVDVITTFPGFIGINNSEGAVGGGTNITFDHTPAESLAFKKYVSNKIGLYNDSLAKYTNYNGVSMVHTTDEPRILTNIGTTFVNVYNRSDGMSFGIDTDVFDQIRMIVHWTKIGTGVQTVQIVEKGNLNNVLISMDVVSGSNISATIPIPDVFKDTTKLYLIQAKSTVAGDDPVFEGLRLYMR